MGMFDYLKINPDKLPVSDTEKMKIRLGKTDWQTKDFDCNLTEVYITDEGELKINRFEQETVPKEKRPYPNDDGIKGIFGMLKRVNERLEIIPHHGMVYFHGEVGVDWYEFSAKFTDGKLVSIEGGKQKAN